MTLTDAVRLLTAHRATDAVARSLTDQLAAEVRSPRQDYGRLADRAINYAECLEDR